MALAPSGAQAVVWDVSGGALIGAKNVMVGGTSYDVRFQDGLCGDIFSDCTFSNPGFAFTDQAGATVAANALLDQVFLDNVNVGGTLYNFDTDPNSIVGCGDILVCSFVIPYFVDINPFFGDSVVVAQNGFLFGDGVDTATLYLSSVDLSSNPSRVFANFFLSDAAVVPLPASLPLFASGLGIAAFFGRRRKKAAA